MDKKEIVNLMFDRLEKLGFELGDKAMSMLEQYYPLVRRKVFINNLIMTMAGIAVISLGWFGVLKGSDENEEAFTILGSLAIGLGVVIFLIGLTHVLNADYYAIQSIIREISELK